VVQIHSPRPLFLESTICVTGKSRENPKSAWYEAKHLCLMPVGRKRSLFFEFIALQRKVRFTDDPFFEKVGTGSGFRKKNQKARSKSCVLPRCHSL
jgi:hypothetical protein